MKTPIGRFRVAEKIGGDMNELVKRGEIKAPIVIGRDHLDAGSVASPNRETEGMLDGSDAIADWPLLNALINTAAGASWVSIHNGGGVGIGFSQHDVLVIGAGGAGLRAAIEASAAGVRVGLVCKSLLGKAHTVMAEGGIAAALANVDERDNWKVHFADTMRASRIFGTPLRAA